MENLKELKSKIKDLNVLFVDDEKEIREGTGQLLQKFFDHIVIASNGEEALEEFEKNDFDVVISDIKMPKINGIDMAKKMQEIKPDLFTVFITASRGQNELVDVKYDLYLTKPLSFEDVIGVLNLVVSIKGIS